MSATESSTTSVRDAIDTIEEAYEFMLAYAAQGRQQEAEAEGTSAIRGYLDRFSAALDTIDQNVPGLIASADSGEAFAQHFSRDTATMNSVIGLLTATDNITSDMIDNTNGMIVVRSFLTDLFFVDQVLLPKR